jgi:hypothetical protein
LRVPEESDDVGLSAQLGCFPLFSVPAYADNLSKGMADMGGFFTPIFQREALFISFAGELPKESATAAYEKLKKKSTSDYDYSENYAVQNLLGGHQCHHRTAKAI